MTGETITGGELLRRLRERGPLFTLEELDAIEQAKADDRPPESKYDRDSDGDPDLEVISDPP